MEDKIKTIKKLLSRNELRILPGNLAYSFFLALVPIISIVFFITTTFNLPNDIITNFINQTFSKEISDLLEPVFTANLTKTSFIPMLLGIVAGMNGCGAIVIASNTIYDFKNSSLLKRLVKSLVLIIILTTLFTFIFFVPLLGRTIINLISTFTSFVSNNEEIINVLYFILQVPFSLMFMFFVIKIIYIIAPDEKIPSNCVNAGALFTTISWLIMTLIFSFYINNIAKYNALYGNLANIVILLIWFYLLAYIFVIGLCMNKKKTEKNIEKNNKMKLEEIRKKVQKNN